MEKSSRVRMPSPPDDKSLLSKIYRNTPLLLIAGLYLILAAYRIEVKSLWVDDAFSIRDAKELTDFNWIRPLYFMVLRAWMAFGNGPVYLKIPTLFFGALSVVSLYFLVKEVFGKSAALIAGLVLSASSTYIYFSQQIRFYTLITLFAVISTWALIALCQKYRPYKLLLYWIILVAGLLVSPTLVLLYLFHPLYVALFYRRESNLLKKYLASGGAVIALCSPYGWFVLEKIMWWNRESWIKGIEVPSVFNITEALSVIGRLVFSFREGVAFSPYAGAAVVVLFLALAVLCSRYRKKETLLVLLSFVLPLAVLLAGSSFELRFFHRKTLFSVLPLIAAAAGVVMMRAPAWARALVLAGYLALNLSLLQDFYEKRAFHGERWEEAAAFLDKRVHRQGLSLVFFPHDAVHAFKYYADKSYHYRLINQYQDLEKIKQDLDAILKDMKNRQFTLILKTNNYKARMLIDHISRLETDMKVYRFDKLEVMVPNEKEGASSRHCHENRCFLRRGDMLTPGDLAFMAERWSGKEKAVHWSAGKGCGDQEGEWSAGFTLRGAVPANPDLERLGWRNPDPEHYCKGNSPWFVLEKPAEEKTCTSLAFRCKSRGEAYRIHVWEESDCDLKLRWKMK
ncbi:MAG: glycosyltransferase family 39 protein [bacterium]